MSCCYSPYPSALYYLFSPLTCTAAGCWCCGAFMVLLNFVHKSVLFKALFMGVAIPENNYLLNWVLFGNFIIYEGFPCITIPELSLPLHSTAVHVYFSLVLVSPDLLVLVTALALIARGSQTVVQVKHGSAVRSPSSCRGVLERQEQADSTVLELPRR